MPKRELTMRQIVELHPVRQVDEATEIAAPVDRQTIVGAVTGKPRSDVIGHLRKRKRDHDEIDTAGAQA
jgi:hypothetical protein